MDLRTGQPFWPRRDGLLHTYPALTHNERTEIAIVGAGITGALAAYELAAAGADVVVVDKRDVVSGSSAATTGLLQYATDTSLTEIFSTALFPAPVRLRPPRRYPDQSSWPLDSSCTSGHDRFGASRRSYVR